MLEVYKPFYKFITIIIKEEELKNVPLLILANK